MTIEVGDLILENVSDEGFYLVVITRILKNEEEAEGYVIDGTTLLSEGYFEERDLLDNYPNKVPEDRNDTINLSNCISIIEKNYLTV